MYHGSSLATCLGGNIGDVDETFWVGPMDFGHVVNSMDDIKWIVR